MLTFYWNTLYRPTVRRSRKQNQVNTAWIPWRGGSCFIWNAPAHGCNGWKIKDMGRVISKPQSKHSRMLQPRTWRTCVLEHFPDEASPLLCAFHFPDHFDLIFFRSCLEKVNCLHRRSRLMSNANVAYLHKKSRNAVNIIFFSFPISKVLRHCPLHDTRRVKTTYKKVSKIVKSNFCKRTNDTRPWGSQLKVWVLFHSKTYSTQFSLNWHKIRTRQPS